MSDKRAQAAALAIGGALLLGWLLPKFMDWAAADMMRGTVDTAKK